MTGLNSILLTGLSGMRASQSAMRVTSQNIANANTPGYVRTEITFAPSSNVGAGAGVDVSDVHRAADRFLATAAYIAQAAQGSSSARSDILARAQAAFGDPTSDNSMFATLDAFWSGLAQIGVDPASTLRRDDAVSSLQATFDEVQRVGPLEAVVDARAAAEVEKLAAAAHRHVLAVVDPIAGFCIDEGPSPAAKATGLLE